MDKMLPENSDSQTTIPPYKDFMEEIQAIYPEGDLNMAYSRIKHHIANKTVCPDGTPVTYRLIMDKFAAHIKQWNLRYRRKEQEGYLSRDAEEKRKDLFSFIRANLYEREWSVSGGDLERDAYIFSNFNIKYLCQKLDEFQKHHSDEQ